MMKQVTPMPGDTSRVVMVLPHFEPFEPTSGALSIISFELAHALSGRCKAGVIGLGGDGPWDHGLDDVRAVKRPSRPRLIAPKLRSVRSGEGARWGHYASAVSRSLKTAETLVVMNDIDLALRLKRPDRAVYLFAQNQIAHRKPVATYRPIDGLLGCSPFICDWLQSHFELPVDRVHLVQNGVRTTQFRPRLRREQDEAIRGLFVGRMDPNKGVLELLEAARLVRRHHPAFELELIGPIRPWSLGEREAAEFETEFHRLARAADARYRGPMDRDAIATAMAQADVIYVPSVSPEPFGLVAAEALASGAAVVVSDRGALPWIAGDAALVTEPTARCLAIATLNLIENPAVRAHLAEVGPARAECFSWSASADQLLSALQSQGSVM